MSSTDRVHRMDTNHSWIIFFCSFLIGIITVGQLLSFGIYFVSFSEYFQLDKKSTSLIGAVNFLSTHVIGLPAGVLQKRYGARIVISIGATLCTLGNIGSYLSQNFWQLYITYGILGGFGFGLSINPALSILPEYFQKRRYLVTALFSICGPFGSFLLAPFTLLMIETYTWRGSMLINASLCAQLFVLGSILKSRKINKHASIRALLTGTVFQDSRFLLILFDTSITGGTCFVVFSTVPDLAMERNLTAWQGASLVSIISLSATIFRTISAFLLSVDRFDRLIVYTASGLFASTGVIGCVFSTTYITFALSLVIFGASYGVKISQAANVIMDLVGADMIAIAMGYFMVFFGLGGITLPLLVGSLADKYGTHNSFLLMFALILVGFLACCLIILLRRKRDGSNNKSLANGQADHHDIAALNGTSDEIHSPAL